MQITQKNIKDFLHRYIILHNIDVAGLSHNPEKDISLRRMGGKYIWEATYHETDKGNKNKSMSLFVNAVSTEVTVKDERGA